MKNIFLFLLCILISDLSVAASQLATESEDDLLSHPLNSSQSLSPDQSSHLLRQSTEESVLQLDENETLLPVDQAFIFSTDASQSNQIKLEWLIAPGYYLYQDKFKFSTPESQLETPSLPIGKVYIDPYFGQVTVYNEPLLTIVLPITRTDKTKSIIVEYQGCAEKGFCYPPLSKTITLPTQPTEVAEISDRNVDIVSPPLIPPVTTSGTYLLPKFLSSPFTLLVTACLFIIFSVYLGVFDACTERTIGWQKLKIGIGIIALIYGILLMIGFASGHANLLQPL